MNTRIIKEREPVDGGAHDHKMCVSSLPELHANIEVVEEVSSERHAILRGENSMDPACRGRQSIKLSSRQIFGSSSSCSHTSVLV